MGQAPYHYRCLQYFVPKTNSILYPDTVEFFSLETPFPKVSTNDYLRQAASDILAILQEPKKSIPSLTYGSTMTNAYIQVA